MDWDRVGFEESLILAQNGNWPIWQIEEEVLAELNEERKNRDVTQITDWKTVDWGKVDFERFAVASIPKLQLGVFANKRVQWEQAQRSEYCRRLVERRLRFNLEEGLDSYLPEYGFAHWDECWNEWWHQLESLDIPMSEEERKRREEWRREHEEWQRRREEEERKLSKLRKRQRIEAAVREQEEDAAWEARWLRKPKPKPPVIAVEPVEISTSVGIQQGISLPDEV